MANRFISIKSVKMILDRNVWEKKSLTVKNVAILLCITVFVHKNNYLTSSENWGTLDGG